VVSFALGLALGGVFGVGIMAMLQINSDDVDK